MKFKIEPKKNPFRTITPGRYRMKVDSIKEVTISAEGKDENAVRIFFRGLEGESEDVMFQTQFLESEPSYVAHLAVALKPEIADQENAEFEINDSLLNLELIGEVKNVDQRGKWVNRIVRYYPISPKNEEVAG